LYCGEREEGDTLEEAASWTFSSVMFGCHSVMKFQLGNVKYRRILERCRTTAVSCPLGRRHSQLHMLSRTAFSALGNLGSVRPMFVAVEADIYRERVITIIGTVEGRLGMTAWRFLSIQC